MTYSSACAFAAVVSIAIGSFALESAVGDTARSCVAIGVLVLLGLRLIPAISILAVRVVLVTWAVGVLIGARQIHKSHTEASAALLAQVGFGILSTWPPTRTP